MITLMKAGTDSGGLLLPALVVHVVPLTVSAQPLKSLTFAFSDRLAEFHQCSPQKITRCPTWTPPEFPPQIANCVGAETMSVCGPAIEPTYAVDPLNVAVRV